MQAQIALQAKQLLRHATHPALTHVADANWKHDPDWRQRYGYVGPENAARLRAIGDARRAAQQAAKPSV